MSGGWLPILAIITDALTGDPRWLTHPVTLMAALVRRLETWLRRSGLPLRAAGAILALTVPAVAWLVTTLAIRVATAIHPWFGVVIAVWLFSTTLAARSLADHAVAIHRPLAAGDLAEARMRLSWIVGRDTDRLAEGEIVRGAVESVAESTSDGVIAPLFWGIIGGAPLAMAYRAVNTLDSLVGHKNERYLKFGWASARLDDLVNLIPARVSALLIALAAGSARALRTALRDAGRHPSPNSGWPEAAMAGALGIQLGGVNYYDGEPEARATLGDAVRPLVARDIVSSVRLMYLATAIAAVAVAAFVCFWR